MRLIDKDALIKRMKALCVEDNGLTDDYKEGLTNSIRAAVKLAENAPEISAVPVVRGEWVSKGGCRCDCSVCGGTVLGRTDRAGWADSAFCGYCGAKMEDKPCG